VDILCPFDHILEVSTVDIILLSYESCAHGMH
jgi:hypothetical protein